jgi:branched-chain amino acid aminotransferase
MEKRIKIPVKKTGQSRLKSFDFKNFSFGKTPTDHFFMAEFKNGNWQNIRIEPFSNISMSPLALCFHYGQTVFEGMKAFRTQKGDISIFRPFDHHHRFNKSLERMCMAQVPEEIFISGVETLVSLDREWLHTDTGNALYIRPFMIASEAKIGVKVSEEYLFMVVCSPIDKYYSKNLKVKVETEFSRAAEGGTGNAKCGGNYGGAFYPTALANKQGFDQIIWTDAKENRYLEESGTMNIMFFIDNVLITPALNNTILSGITRNSILSIARDMGMKVEETKISYADLEDAFHRNKTVEAFGVGTVAVVSPIESIIIHGKEYKTRVDPESKMYRLKQRLEEIRTGKYPDNHGWNHLLPSQISEEELILHIDDFSITK